MVNYITVSILLMVYLAIEAAGYVGQPMVIQSAVGRGPPALKNS